MINMAIAMEQPCAAGPHENENGIVGQHRQAGQVKKQLGASGCTTIKEHATWLHNMQSNALTFAMKTVFSNESKK